MVKINAFMNIQVRVLSTAAQARIKMLEGELAALQKQTMATGMAMNRMGSYGIPALSKWGNQIQWAGRQLQYNFTLPILLAGGAATKFALDNEKAMTRVIKVYGDGSNAFRQLSKTEIPALSRAFEELSNQFGVNQAQVINIAADWAAAGASGLALAKAVKLTMETMILGELDAADATQSLIAIQAQYGQSVDDLAKTIDILNMVENQTGISMAGLIQGMVRAAGVARSAGVDVQHLAAFMAALVPSAGSAANAGNALKTILSRLLSPTKEAAEVMGLMGINTKSMAWQSLNGSQRLEEMAKKFKGLDSAQKAVVSSTIASRWQINKFDVLMRDIINTNGYYQKALRSTADAQRNFKQRVYELNTVLESNPQRLKQIWVILQNAMADVIQPLIPYIVYLAAEIAKLVRAFANMNPVAQKAALAGLVFLAAIGPIARYVGAVANMIGLLTIATHFFGAKLASVAKIIVAVAVGPFKLLWFAFSNTLGYAVGFAARLPVLMAVAFERAMVAVRIITGLPVLISGILIRSLVMFRVFAAAIPVAMAAATPVVGTMTLILGAMQAAASVGLAKVAMIFINFGARLPVILGTAQAVMAASWTAFTQFLPFALGVMRAGVMAIWITMYSRMAAISAAGTVLLSGFWTRLGAWIYAATIGLQVRLVQLWTVMMARLSALTIAGSLTMVRGWAMGLVGMLTATATTLRGLPVLFLRFGKFLVSWPALIAMAILGILYAFRNQIAQAWKNIVASFSNAQGPIGQLMSGIAGIFNAASRAIQNAFWALPGSVRNALMAVVRIVQAAAMAVYRLFSYLNPWAHHSPSLVESVTSGMDEIQRQYARASSIGDLFATVARDLARFKAIAATMGKGPFQEERQDVAKHYARALPVFDALVRDWKQLNALLDKQDTLVKAQQAVVDKWKSSLDAANSALDREQKKLDDLQNALGKLNDEYEKHQTAMENYASAPLVGMKDMENQIFANDQAQKALRLEMLKWEDVNGSIEDVRNNYEQLQGDISMLQQEASTLRSSGAGSDILGPMQQQIDAMQAQSDALANTINNSPMATWQKQLNDLQHQAEELDLEKALKFEPLQKQIADLVDTTKELTFDQVVAGITNEKNAMAGLQPQIDALTAAVDQQQAAVDAATTARDKLQAVYDVENDKLQKLQDAYNKTKDAISSVEDALQSMASKASQANSALAKAKGGGGGGLSPGAANFKDAAGANFPDVGGMAKIGREGGMGDQSKLIDDFTKGITGDIAKTFGSFDILGPLKKKWSQGWAWLKENVGPSVSPVVGAVGAAFSGMSNPISGNSGFAKGFKSIFSSLGGIASDAFDTVKNIVELFWPDIKRIFKAFADAGKQIWNELGPELAKFGPVFANLGDAIKGMWKIAKPLIAFFGISLVAALKLAASIISQTLGPVLHNVISLIGNVIQVIRGFVEIIVGIFSGDWKMVWKGVEDIVAGTFGAIWAIIRGAGEIIWGIIKGIVTGIWEFFVWLYDVLIGHSIIPDIVNGIIAVFQLLLVVPKWIWNNILLPIWNFFKDVWNSYIQPFLAGWFDKIKAIWAALTTLGKWVWDNIVKPIWDKFSDAMGNVKGVMNDARDKVNGAFQSMKDKASDVVNWIKGIPGMIKNVGGDFKDAGEAVIGKLWSGMKNAGSIIGDLAGDIWQHVKGFLNSGIDAVNNAIPNSIGTGPLKVDLPDNPFPHFYKGGIVPGSRAGTLIVAGDRGHDEAIVPLTGPYAPRAGGNIPAGMNQGSSDAKVINFYGDLSFPNITDGGDAEDFIRNLEGLAG